MAKSELQGVAAPPESATNSVWKRPMENPTYIYASVPFPLQEMQDLGAAGT